jgi:hypothetical protein
VLFCEIVNALRTACECAQNSTEHPACPIAVTTYATYVPIAVRRGEIGFCERKREKSEERTISLQEEKKEKKKEKKGI